MKKTLLSLFVLSIVGISAVMAVSPPPFNSNSPDPVPVDGGAGILLAAGAAYGVKKFRDMRKKKAEGEQNQTNEA